MHTGLCINESFISRARMPQSFLEDILSRQNQSHDTFASWHMSSGTQNKELMEVGNWKSLSSMADYQHLNEGRKKEVGRKLEGKLLE